MMELKLSNLTDHSKSALNMFKTFVAIEVACLEVGNFAVKMGVSFVTAILLTPIALFMEWAGQYIPGFLPFINKDGQFIRVLILSLLIDAFFGMWKHFKAHTFDWKRLFVGFVEKVGVSFGAMIVLNLFGGIEEMHAIPALDTTLQLVGKLMNVVYVLGSALSSMYIVTGGKFPPVAFMKRIRKFNETLDPAALTQNVKRKEPTPK